jgi:hypothetical protein
MAIFTSINKKAKFEAFFVQPIQFGPPVQSNHLPLIYGGDLICTGQDNSSLGQIEGKKKSTKIQTETKRSSKSNRKGERFSKPNRKEI